MSSYFSKITLYKTPVFASKYFFFFFVSELRSLDPKVSRFLDLILLPSCKRLWYSHAILQSYCGINPTPVAIRNSATCYSPAGEANRFSDGYTIHHLCRYVRNPVGCCQSAWLVREGLSWYVLRAAIDLGTFRKKYNTLWVNSQALPTSHSQIYLELFQLL